jgi:hypothetical protein
MTTKIITDVTHPDWAGEFDEPIDLNTIQFTAVEVPRKDECKGCLFRKQPAAKCAEAEVIAEHLDLPTCAPRTGPTFIYVLDRTTDPRQIRIKNTTEENNE